MNAINEILAPANWEFTSPKDKLYSSDHVIDAYLKGKNDGLEQQQRLILEKLMSNIQQCGKHTGEILAFFKTIAFNPVAAYLKIDSWDDFSILIILPQGEFLNEKMLAAYDFISTFEQDIASDMYHVQVIVCDTEERIDESYVRADGFALKHKM